MICLGNAIFNDFKYMHLEFRKSQRIILFTHKFALLCAYVIHIFYYETLITRINPWPLSRGDIPAFVLMWI